MANPFTMLAGTLSLFSILLPPLAVHAEDGKELFQKQCTSCHSIGGGDSVGPDLKGVATRRSPEWITTIITDPDRLTAEKDPAQLELVKKYGMTMPKLGISRDDAARIVAFLGGGATPAAPASPPPTASPAPSAAHVVPTRQLIASGLALFTGKTRFSNGGAPCVSCHNLRYPGIFGGALAGDLTAAYSGMGESGLRGVLKSLGFPIMRRIYADRPLTEPEANALVALFQDASARKGGEENPYPIAGLGFFVIFVLAALLLKRRIR